MSGGEIEPYGPYMQFKRGTKVGDCALYDISKDEWSRVQDLNFARSFHSMVALQDGTVFAICGINA